MPLTMIRFLPFILLWALLVHWQMAGDWQWLWRYLPFSGMGVIGAIFANSTGAGGGVVFIPAFQWLDFSDQQSVATSFAIQCMGMTAGSLSWLAFAKSDEQHADHWQPFIPTVLLCAVCSVIGISAVQSQAWAAPGSLKQIFSLFSLVLGAMLLFSVLRLNRQADRYQLSQIDLFAVVSIGILGGMITAWLSVGVGEVLALYLLMRGFSATVSVAAAVCVSALSVWAAIAHHVVADNVVWEVLLFAGPAAVLGGTIARYIAVWMPPRTLKIFFSGWVLFMGVVTSPLQQYF